MCIANLRMQHTNKAIHKLPDLMHMSSYINGVILKKDFENRVVLG